MEVKNPAENALLTTYTPHTCLGNLVSVINGLVNLKKKKKINLTHTSFFFFVRCYFTCHCILIINFNYFP